MSLLAALRSDVYRLLHVSCTYRNQNKSTVIVIRVVVILSFNTVCASTVDTYLSM